MAPRRFIAYGLLLATISFRLPAQQQNDESESSSRSVPAPYARFVEALRKQDTNTAFGVLDKLPETDKDFVPTMALAGRLLADNDWAARGLPYVVRAYRKAPDDMAVVHDYIRVMLLARTNLSQPLVARPKPTGIPAEFKFITEAPKVADSSQAVPRRRLLYDLDYLEVALANAYAYADRRGANWRGALDAFRASLGEETPINTFKLRLRRFLTLFGDPHTSMRASVSGLAPEGAAPFLPVDDGDKVLALSTNRSGFLDDTCRYLSALDGVPVAEWLRVAGYDVPKASPQWAQRESVAGLVKIGSLRAELGLPAAGELRVTLVSRDGAQKRELTLPVPAKAVRPGSWPRGDTRRLKDNFGYLRIRQMDTEPKFLAKLDESMAGFRDTRGLVIDVRANGGGSQDALRTLMPYLLQPGAPMKIVNVAAYRLPVRLTRPCSEGYLGLANRGLYPETSRTWSTEQRGQIHEFLETFTPSWKLAPGRFSAWHVMAISASGNPKAYRYTNQVVVLMDSGCFSATDNFLGALKGLPNVTLMGTASGGGSGRMTMFTLPKTRITLSVCQMASFRANGDIFDGRGVAPDVVLRPQPEDYLRDRADTMLEAAVTRLR